MSIEESIVKHEQSRPGYTFTVPPKIGKRDGITSVTLVELTAEEEMTAAHRAHSNLLKIANEQAKESLRAINGKPVSTYEGTVDQKWNRMDPRLRNLIVTAYQRIHSPDQDDAAAFLESVTVE